MAQIRDEKGRIVGGPPPNGLDKRPQDRGKGFWKREDTPRYKLEQMMKLTIDELGEIADDKSAPLFDRKLAIAISAGQWREIKEMIHEIYGKPRETVDLKSSVQADPDSVRAVVAKILNDKSD